MVSSTRSAKKNTDEFVGNSSKKKMVNKEQQSNLTTEKADVLGLRRSAREKQSSRLKTPSPQSTRKSGRLESQTPPVTPPVKRKSDRIEKHNLTSTPRKSDRGKKINLSSSSGSKQSGKRLSPLNVKKKETKEKSLKQLTVESRKAEPDLNSVGTKRKKMDARTYKALFKPQKIKYTMPDVSEELPRQDKPPAVNSRGISSEPIGKSEESSGRMIRKLVNESSGTASGVDVLENDIDGKLSQSFPVHSGNDEPSQPPDGDGLKNLETGCTIIDILDDEERAPRSSIKNVEVPDLRSADGSEDDVRCIQPKGIKHIDMDLGLSSIHASKDVSVIAGSVPSSGHEVHHLLGTCIICSRKKRLDYDSPEEELCSCGASSNIYSNDFSKDRGDQEAAIYSESAGRCSSGEHLNEIHSDHRMGGPENVCVICNQGGELLCCIGNGCKRCYHLLCLDPPLSDVPPGVWHCLWCVKKKVELGSHSVSQGVESIWNAREVEVPNAEGVQRQKQYLVKYHGLAHVHNHWVPEKQLLPKNYYLIAEFNSKHQVVRWNAEWTVPQRLLKKRSIIFSRQQNKLQITPSTDISDCHEWLVKWHGLGYEHASWELDNSYTLRSPRGQNLMKDYEIRLQKAKRKVDKSKKGSNFDLSELPVGESLPNSYNLLKHVNKLRQCWYNNQNAVVFDNQEWAMTVIFFVLSLTEVCQPFLMIVASDAISQWEAEFTRLAPSIAVTVYSGSRDTRRSIRTFEFYEEGGCMMLHVLLSSPEAVFEDLDILRCIRWEAVIIDECQHSGIENHWEQIKMLPTDSRILLFNGQIKDTVSEYLNLLSLLDSHEDMDKFRGFKSDTIDNLGKLKERLSHFIAYGSIPELSKFVEYWVPVPVSNCQLEQYCATLLSNSIPLRSCSKSDPVGALRDILFTVRKCCDHPYLVDSSVQEGLIAEGRANELLDTGIKACGKLQLLDIILSEIKNLGQQVLILFQQTIVGLGGASIGDILDDFMRQRFGPNSYERIDAGVAPSKKHATVNRFNKKETGQFVFLLGNRACSSSIKLSSVDIVIIYDSEWNPANDLRALQKISFNSKFEQIKVFRLYSSCTVEEKALLLAKQVVNLDNNLQNLSRTTSDTLLMWGASYLFSKLDDYHAESSPTSVSNISSEQLLLNDTTKELLAILSGSCDSGCIISKVQLGVGHYSINLPLLGEGKIQLKDAEEAHVFWRNLLEGRNPRWKHSCGSTPRNRKRVQYFDGINRNPDTDGDEVGKKRRKVANENVDPASIQVELKGHQMNLADGSKRGSSKAVATKKSQSLEESTSCRTDNVNPESKPNFICGQSSFDPGVHVDKPQEIVTASNEQKSLHISLKGEMARLCQILKVSGDVMHMVERFLEYVIKNHHVSNESPTIIQAFQISLCWIAASILKQKIDKKDSLVIAKQFLNYGCTEEQATHVYSKMRLLKKMFLQCSENNKESRKDCLLSTEDISKESCKADAGIPQYSAVDLQNVKSDIERSANKEPSGYPIVSEHKKPMNDKVAECETEEKLKKIQKKCDKRLKILIQKQQEEVKKFHRIWEEKRERLENEHKLESACIRSIHGQGSAAIDKLQLLDSDFAKKMEEFKRLKDMRVKDLEANQLSARSYERQKAVSWLAKAKGCHTELKVVDEPVGCQSEDKVGCSEVRAHITICAPENAAPIFKQHTEDKNPNNDVHLMQGNDVAPSNMCVIAHAEAVGTTAPTETADHQLSITSERELGTSSFERTLIAELPSELIHSSNTTGEMASGNLPGSGELVSDEIPMVQASEEIPTEVPATVSEDVSRVHPVERIDVSNKKCDKGDIIDSNLSDAVNQRDGNESIGGCLSLVEQSLLPPTETIAPSDGSLPQCHVPLESSISGEFRDEDAPVSENRSALQVEVAISKHIDSENPAPSNDHLPEYRSTLQVEDATLDCINSEPPTQSNQAPVTENHEQLHPVSMDVSLSCDQTPAGEVEHENLDRERILIPETSAQLSGELESRPYQIASQSGQDLVEHPPVALMGSTLDCDHLDLGLVNQVDHVPNGEWFAFSQSNASMPQAVVNTAELPNQVILQSEVDLSHARGSGNLTSQPTYQVPTWHPTSSLHAEPLQNELLRISKETEKAVKVHEDLKKLLKSECEKEIQEVIAQIHNKYEAKLHDAETAFQLKKNELDKNHNKVLMNRILAEAFRSKCLDLRPSGPPGMQRAMSSSFMQQLQQLSMQRPVRHPVSSVSQPQTMVPTAQTSQQLPLPNSTVPSPVFVSSSRNQPRNVTPTVQAAHQPPLPHSAGPPPGFLSSSGCQPAASPHNPTPAVQSVRRASARLSGLLTRPPLISAITPSTGNLRIGDVRSPAPHLQPFRASTSNSAASLPLHSHAMPIQQSPTPHPATSPFSQHTPQQTSHSQVLPLSQQLPLPTISPITRNRPQPESRTSASHNSSQSAVQLLMDMDHRPRVHGHNTFASLPDIGTNFGSLEQSNLETLGNVQGTLPSSVATEDVVYLSDED